MEWDRISGLGHNSPRRLNSQIIRNAGISSSDTAVVTYNHASHQKAAEWLLCLDDCGVEIDQGMTGRLWDHLYSAQNARKRPTSTMALCLAKMDALLQAMWHCCKLLQTLCNLGIVSYRQNARYYRLLPYCTYSVDIDNQDKTPQSCWVRMINIPETPYRAMWILQAMEVRYQHSSPPRFRSHIPHIFHMQRIVLVLEWSTFGHLNFSGHTKDLHAMRTEISYSSKRAVFSMTDNWYFLISSRYKITPALLFRAKPSRPQCWHQMEASSYFQKLLDADWDWKSGEARI